MLVFFPPVNHKLEVISRNRRDYPYSYDPYLIHQLKPYEESCLSLYHDRLINSFTSEEILKAKLKVFGKDVQSYEYLCPKQIESFLKLLFNNHNLVLHCVTQGCNVNNGYPFWVFFYKI